MKAQITSIEVIKETSQSDKATVIRLDSAPSIEDQEKLFSINDSVVLEF